MPSRVPERLAFAAELAVVVMVAFGYFILSSVVSLFSPEAPRISEADLQVLVLVELLTMMMLAFLLQLRGWRLEHLGLVPSWDDLAQGWKFVGVAVLAYVAASELLGAVAQGGETARSSLVEAGIRPGFIATVSLVNATYEEVFVTGYLVAALRPRTSPWTPVLASALLRASYHLYQGPGGVLIIMAMGLAFAYWFARNGRLWPLIAAHAALDFFALAGETSA